MQDSLLPQHIITGCDTTSVLQPRKNITCNLFNEHICLEKDLSTFNISEATTLDLNRYINFCYLCMVSLILSHWMHSDTVYTYSTGVQIVSCTLSDDSVLSESTGLFNPVLCVSQWNLCWQKNQPIRLCLSNQVRPGREWFPSPLGDFNRLFEGPIGELFKIWHWNMFYFFKWHQFGP